MEKKSLTKNGIFYLLYNVLNLLFPLITGIYVARVLLPKDVGAVAAAQNLTQYFIMLGFLGIPTYGMREIAKVRDDLEERNKVFSELFVINIISTTVSLIVYLIIINVVGEYKKDIVLYYIVGIAVLLNYFNISWLYEGLEEFKFISLRNFVFKVINFVLLIIFVQSTDDRLMYAFITVLGTAGNYLINVINARKFVHIRLRKLAISKHMKSVMYLTAVNLAIEVYSLVDVSMMNFLCPKNHIAYYKYGNGIQKILLTVVNTFTMVLIPRISFYYKREEYDLYNRLLRKALLVIIIIATPMIIGIGFTADTIIQLLYGTEYLSAATLLKWFAILLLVSPIGYLLGSRVLLASGHENKMIYPVAIGAIVNVILNAILIPKYMEFGATIASICSEVVVMVVYVILGRNLYNLKSVTKEIYKILFANTVMLLYLFLLMRTISNECVLLVLQILGGIILYAGTLLIVREEIIVENINKKIK